MHYFYLIIPTIISLINIHSYGMEQKVVPYNRQKMMVLHLDDGNDFPIERRKIFDSEALHTDYLRRKLSCGDREVKNMSLLYSQVNREQMKLYNDACDIDPGKPFEIYFNTLLPEKKRSLIITAGELKNSVLCGELWQAYVNSQFTNKNIKPRMQQLVWWYRCINQIVKENIPIVFPTHIVEESIAHKYTNNGHIQAAPLSLLKGSYDGEYCGKHVTYNGKQWLAFLVKPLDGSYEYHVTKATSINETEEKEKNKMLLWLNHDDRENEKSIIIDHEDPILDSFFSYNGEYLVSYSNKNLLLSKIKKENGELCVTPFIIPISLPISNVKLNLQATVCAVSCWDENEKKGSFSLWNISEGNCVKIFEREDLGFISHASFNDAGDRLLALSTEDETEKVLIWNTDNVNNVALIGSIEPECGMYFESASCSPNRKKWIIKCIDFRLQYCIFVDECYDGFKVFNLDDSTLYGEVRIAYSPNGLFVAILYPQEDERLDLVVLYSVITHERLGHWYVMQAEGLGFTADSRKLIFNHSNVCCSKIDLLNQENINNLDDLFLSSSLAQLTILRRLCWAHDHGDIVELYEEGQSYKAFLKLSEQHRKLIAKCFPGMKVIDNNKDVSETCKDVAQIADAW